MLLFVVLWRMTGRLWPSALVAGLFAVHPLRVESVAWVTERKDVLSGLCFVLTLGAYVGYVRHRFSLLRYLAVMVCFGLGLMAKPMLVTLPFVLLLLDYWPLERMAVTGRENARGHGAGSGSRFSLLMRLVVEKLPLLVLVVLSCKLTVWSQAEALQSLECFPLWWRMCSAANAYVVYLGQLFCPVSLAVLYPRLDFDVPVGKVAGAVLLLVMVTAAVLLCRRRRPYLLIGWLWYLGMLVPVIGLVQLGSVASADRYTYLPQIGLAVALVWGTADLCRSWAHRRWLCGAASALVLAVLMGGAWRQTSFWRNGETLWAHAVLCTSENLVAHNNLGNALMESGRLDEAIAQYRKALQIDPRHAEMHYNLGNVLLARGELDAALAEYQEAVKLRPDHPFARTNMASVLARQGRFAEAAGHFQRAMEIRPDFPDVINNLAWLRATCPEAGLRSGAEAVTLAQRVNQLSGYGRPDYLDTLAAAYAEAGRLPEALETGHRALELARQQNQPALADALRARIALYQAGKPYHAPRPAPAVQPPKR
jgi:tetratricopeptide (TPR) repeat protein